MVAATFHDACH